MPALSRTFSPFIRPGRQGRPWLIEIVGPQYAGKTTIADLLALALDENATKCVRVENDMLIHGFFPGYVKLRSSNQRERAHAYMSERRPLLHDLSIRIIRKALQAGYTVIYDHLETHVYRHGKARHLCMPAKAGYLSVHVTAPLDRLRERWNERDRDPPRVKELEATYRKLQALAKKIPFKMTIDTSVTSADEGAKRLLSTMYPRLNADVLERTTIQHPRRRPRGFANSKVPRPLARLDKAQLVRVKDAYVLTSKHQRLLLNQTHFDILRLMDGRHTVGDLSEKTDADPHTVQTFLDTLRDARLVAG
jgi:thymidylate kinase